MTGKVIELLNVISPDMKAVRITEKWQEWDSLRQQKKLSWEEIRKYVYAVDTTSTTNSKLPWKNKTTVPKLCQIRDNILANYTLTMFPKRKSMLWEADERDANSVQKRDAIVNYMTWVQSQPSYRPEIEKVLMDFVDFGNCFVTVEWTDQRVDLKNRLQVGYVGPSVRRIHPLNIVFNPTAENFEDSPKIVRSLVSMGEVKEILSRMSNDENREEYQNLYDYLKDVRFKARNFEGDWSQFDNLYSIDGFTSFRNYLLSDTVEILTFYGDWYDPYTDQFEKNRVITVVDRHKLMGDKANPSYFGYPPIFHATWRRRQDNLWGMGPLDNLVGMQYRMDHVENLKADVFDLVTYPVQIVKGFVQDFTWQPGEKIFSDEEGSVEIVAPDVQALNANLEIQNLERLMEEMAGAPREAMGFRTPGEKTAYEVSRMENASSRIYQHRTYTFEELLEKLANAQLELAKRNMGGSTTVKVFDDQFNLITFQDLSVEDITGVGRIKPVASRHFAEQAELVQNLTNLTNSNLWPTVQPHFSGKKLAKILEKIFNLEDFEVVQENIAMVEQAEAQKQVQALQEQVHKNTMTATGMGEDYDVEQQPNPFLQQLQQGNNQ